VHSHRSFHADGGWSSCGDAPDRAAQAQSTLADLDAWLGGDESRSARSTPVKRWLAGSPAKHIRSQTRTGRIVC